MAYRYTYYDSNGVAEISLEQPHEGVGRVWVRGEYHHPTHPSPLDVRVGRGPQVWTIIAALQTSGIEELLRLYAPALTREDVAAAEAFYESHKEQIDPRVCEYRAVA